MGGTLRLSAPAGGNRIRVYENADRTEPVTLPASWALGSEPETLYVEGVVVSSTVRDVELELRFTPSGGNGVCSDIVKLTVVQVDLDAANLADLTEEVAPGRLMAENDDFDENKGDPNVQRNPDDADASPVFENGQSIVTDDLVPLTRAILPPGDALLEGSTITLTKVAGPGAVRVLAIKPNPDPPLVDDWVEVPLGANLRDDYFISTGQYKLFNWYAEGLTAGEVTLELKFDNGPMPVKDRVTLTVVDLDVVELTFKGIPAEFFVIKKDDGSGDYGTPHWKDANDDGDADDPEENDQRYPAAYLRGKHVKLDLKITVDPPDVLWDTVRVRGAGSHSYAFQQDTMPTSFEINVASVSSDPALNDWVDCFNPFELHWSVSPDDGLTWIDAGRTDNQLYVTLGTPNSGSRFHTLLHNSCRDAAGNNTDSAVIAGIWGDFTDQVVYRVDPTGRTDGTQLTYYNDWMTDHTSTALLLEHADGQCTAWAKFLIDAIGAQGINQQNGYVKLAATHAGGFLVADWSFPTGPGLSRHATFPYLNLPQAIDNFCNQDSFLWLFAEVTDRTGLPGQGTDSPLSLFGYHQVVKISGHYYDPSYGEDYAPLADLENQAIHGYLIAVEDWPVNEADVGLDLNGNGNQTDIVPTQSFLIQKNLPGNNLTETSEPYP